MHDSVIREGTVIDGTGALAVTRDVAVDDGLITVAGEDVGSGEVIYRNGKATGKLPGKLIRGPQAAPYKKTEMGAVQ